MSVENYSEVILRQKHGIEDTLAKIVQDRKVHKVELDNIYTEGVRDLVHPKILDSLQEKIMKREMTNHNKGQVDAMEWSKHDNSLLERLSGRLEGGDVTPRLHKNLRYTAKRGNSFFLNLNKKLHQDRGIHMRELEQVVDEAKRSGVSPQFVTFLDKTLENRKLYNSRKTALDVAQWEQLDTGVSRLLKNDSQKVLSAGAFPTEISGGFRMTELQKQNYRTAKKLIRGGGIEEFIKQMRDHEEKNREMKADETIEVEEIICGTVEIMKNKWMNFKTENDETVIRITVPWRPGDKRVTLKIHPYPLGKVTFLESVVSNLRYLLSKMLNSKSFEVNENDDIYVRSGGVGQYTNEKERELYKKLSFKKVDPPRMGEPDLMKTKIFEFQKKLNFYIGRTHELKYEDEDKDEFDAMWRRI